jgi:hypothetical protein
MDVTREASTPGKKKKAYNQPAVKKVPLRPQEAVLGFCKNSTVVGPRGVNCKSVSACSTMGS